MLQLLPVADGFRCDLQPAGVVLAVLLPESMIVIVKMQ
jgi:hypothetical protein